MGPLVRVMYSGLTQSVFILDRVKSSSCDYPAKIPVDVYSNASCFTCFSSGSSSSKVAVLSDFALGLFYRLGLSLRLCTIQCLWSALQQLCSKISSTSERLLRTCTCPVSKKKIARPLFHRQLTRPWAHAFKCDLRFTPPICDYSRSPSTWD
jgi:hypothetical protein